MNTRIPGAAPWHNWNPEADEYAYWQTLLPGDGRKIHVQLETGSLRGELKRRVFGVLACAPKPEGVRSRRDRLPGKEHVVCTPSLYKKLGHLAPGELSSRIGDLCRKVLRMPTAPLVAHHSPIPAQEGCAPVEGQTGAFDRLGYAWVHEDEEGLRVRHGMEVLGSVRKADGGLFFDFNETLALPKTPPVGFIASCALEHGEEGLFLFDGRRAFKFL